MRLGGQAESEVCPLLMSMTRPHAITQFLHHLHHLCTLPRRSSRRRVAKCVVVIASRLPGELAATALRRCSGPQQVAAPAPPVW